MRFVDIDPDALVEALGEVARRDGVDRVLDLRADAYGFGLAATSALARDLGFRQARVCASQQDHSVLARSTGEAERAWVSAAHARGGQRFVGTIVHVKRVDAGASVSYGGHYTTATPSTLALVTLGFADGLPRLNPAGGAMESAGASLPIAGRIAMDQCVLDCGDQEPSVGQEVTAWGGVVGIDQWSQWSQRSVWALSAGISPRVGRRGGERRG